MFLIRQNATHFIPIGPFVAVGDGFTPVTNLDMNVADAAYAILHDNGTVVDISGYSLNAIANADGYYHLSLQAAISSTVGHMVIVINDDSLCLPVRADFTVVEEAVYDSLYAASAAGPLQSTTAARKLDVTEGGTAGIDWGNVENKTTSNDLTGTNIKTDQKVDVNTLKTQAITCGAGVEFGVYVGSTAAASIHTAANVYTAFGDGSNLTTCATATGFATPTNITSASGVTLTNLSDANAGKLEDMLDGTGAVLTLSQLVVAGNNETASILVTNLGTNGDGMSVQGGSAGDGIVALGVGGGVDIRADITGNITGDLSGSAGSVTTKTGFKLASDGLDSVTSWTVDISGTVSGNSTHDAAGVYTAFGDGSNLTTCATATGFATPTNITSASGVTTDSASRTASKATAAEIRTATGMASADLDTQLATLSTHAAADVYTAFGDGSNLTTCATATGLSTHDAADVKTAIEAAGSSLALIKAVTDALTAAAAAKLALSAGQIIAGTVDTVTNSHTPTSTEFQADNITTAAADHYIGRIIIFTGSSALVGQATTISDYALVGGIGQFTVVAMTEEPANNDTFVIV